LRVRTEDARHLEERKDFARAIHYYEIAGLLTEAKRIRATQPTDIAMTSGGRKFTASEIYEKNIDAVVTVLVSSFNSRGSGTGFFVKWGGWIVTNNHVIDEAREITVQTNDNHRYPAKLIYTVKTPDFAILKVELPFHPVVKIGRSANLKAGDQVFAIGSPGDGQGGILTGSIADGIVSNVNRMFQNNRVIQISAPINHGNSGGPLFSQANEVIGVNTFGLGTAATLEKVIRTGLSAYGKRCRLWAVWNL
jgi:S1-C subfamily serine protease